MTLNPSVAAMATALALGLPAAIIGWKALRRHGRDVVDALMTEVVVGIGVVGGTQSYISLRQLAITGGLDEFKADTWPAVVDSFAVVMGLAALRASTENHKDRYATVLAVLYSLGAIAGNLAIGVEEVQTRALVGLQAVVTLIVHGLPVTTMLLGAHWLMRRTAHLAARKAAAQVEVEATPVQDATASTRTQQASPSETTDAPNTATPRETPKRKPTTRPTPDADRPRTTLQDCLNLIVRGALEERMALGTRPGDMTGGWLARQLGVSSQAGQGWMNRVRDHLDSMGGLDALLAQHRPPQEFPQDQEDAA